MGDQRRNGLDWAAMSDEDRAWFVMWVLAVLLLPIAVPLYVARRLLERLGRRRRR